MKASYDTYATELLFRSCPRAVSKSQEMLQAKMEGFKMIREAEYCGDLPALELRVESPMMCHMAAMNIDGWTSFAWSTKGLCLVFERDCQQGFLDNFDYNVYATLD